MYIHHATGTVGGDDHELIVLAWGGRAGILADSGAQDRRPVPSAHLHPPIQTSCYPTDDVRLLTKAAIDALDRVFRPGFNYSKAEVMLLNLCQRGEYADNLFATSQPSEATEVMAVLDQINGRWGRETLRSTSVPANPE